MKQKQIFSTPFFSSQLATDPSPSTRNLWEKAGSSLEASSLDNRQVEANPVESIRYQKNMSCLLFNVSTFRPGILGESLWFYSPPPRTLPAQAGFKVSEGLVWRSKDCCALTIWLARSTYSCLNSLWLGLAVGKLFIFHLRLWHVDRLSVSAKSRILSVNQGLKKCTICTHYGDSRIFGFFVGVIIY